MRRRTAARNERRNPMDDNSEDIVEVGVWDAALDAERHGVGSDAWWRAAVARGGPDRIATGWFDWRRNAWDATMVARDGGVVCRLGLPDGSDGPWHWVVERAGAIVALGDAATYAEATSEIRRALGLEGAP
jgi:hypothetical protein